MHDRGSKGDTSCSHSDPLLARRLPTTATYWPCSSQEGSWLRPTAAPSHPSRQPLRRRRTLSSAPISRERRPSRRRKAKAQLAKAGNPSTFAPILAYAESHAVEDWAAVKVAQEVKAAVKPSELGSLQQNKSFHLYHVHRIIGAAVPLKADVIPTRKRIRISILRMTVMPSPSISTFFLPTPRTKQPCKLRLSLAAAAPLRHPPRPRQRGRRLPLAVIGTMSLRTWLP